MSIETSRVTAAGPDTRDPQNPLRSTEATVFRGWDKLLACQWFKSNRYQLLGCRVSQYMGDQVDHVGFNLLLESEINVWMRTRQKFRWGAIPFDVLQNLYCQLIWPSWQQLRHQQPSWGLLLPVSIEVETINNLSHRLCYPYKNYKNWHLSNFKKEIFP